MRHKTLLLLLMTWFVPGVQGESIDLWNVRFSLHPIEVGSGEKSFVFADLNQDAVADLVVAHDEPGTVTAWFGNRDGNFSRSQPLPAGRNPSDLSAADLDGDGDIDVVVANHETAHVTVLLGDGRGGLEPAPGSPVSVAVQPHPHVARLADLNGDQKLDLLVDHRSGEGILAIAGLGGGAFHDSGVLINMGGDPYLGMAIGDINTDGRPDLATPNPDEVGIALNTSEAAIAFETIQPVRVASPFAVALADFNADGTLDLAVASDGANSSVQLLLGDGRGRFSQWGEPIPMRSGGKSLNVGDFDGDGVSDVLATSWSSHVLVIRGGTLPLQAQSITLDGIVNPWGVAASDLNEDGRDDFVIADGIRPLATIFVSSAPESDSVR